MHRTKFLSSEEVEVLQKDFLAGSEESGWKIIMTHTLYFLKLMRNHPNLQSLEKEDREDLLTEIQISVFKNMKAFQPQKGKFTTFSFWHVQNCIREYYIRTSAGVKIPPNAWKLVAEIQKVSKELNLDGSEASVQNLAEKLKVKEYRIRDLLPFCFGKLVSEQSVITFGLDSEERDFIDSFEAEGPSVLEMLITEERLVCYYRALNCLSDREKDILLKRYPRDTDSVATLENLGKKYKITRERVRQIEATAKQKVKNNIKAMV